MEFVHYLDLPNLPFMFSGMTQYNTAPANGLIVLPAQGKILGGRSEKKEKEVGFQTGTKKGVWFFSCRWRSSRIISAEETIIWRELRSGVQNIYHKQ